MKNRSSIFPILFIFIVLFSYTIQAIEVDPSGTHMVGDNIYFRPTNSNFGNAYEARWDFGDGTTYTTTYGMETVTHSYNSSGSYTVTVVGRFANITPITETTTVIVYKSVNNRYIEVDPGQPIVGQAATFRAYNFSTPDGIVWDMGDGTILKKAGRRMSRYSGSRNAHRFSKNSPMGTDVVTHIYSAPGNYTVKAYDFYGDDTAITKNITVRLPERGITYSPIPPLAGAPVQFTAVNFLSGSIDWTFGDGTSISGGVGVSHVYNSSGTYTVTAQETNSNYTPVSIIINVTEPNRSILVSPTSPRVDQMVYCTAQNFVTTTIDWNFGDGTTLSGASTMVTHRFQNPGIYTISAKDSTINHTPITYILTVGAENRYIMVSPPEVRTNETITATAYNFRGDFILWNFGDGTQRSGLHSETHQYSRAGTYTITAQDENGASQKVFSTQVIVKGINDQVNLEIAQITLDNGKHYKIVPKNSKNIRAILKMKMMGTGIVSGYWVVDGHPFEFFNEVTNQGEIKEIFTRTIPGLPTITPGIHTITLVLTRPGSVFVTFPTLKYFVLPHENILNITAPPDGFIAKEKEIPEFSWEEPQGASKYQIAFSNYLYPLINENATLTWHNTGTKRTFTPNIKTWNNIKRNRWTYWKVRALDSNQNVIAESDVIDIKVVIGTADINVNEVTDLKGNKIDLQNNQNIHSDQDDLLIHGSIKYKGESHYLVLRVYVENELMDQLLFRNFKKGEERFFETALPNKKKKSQVQFKVLRVSSPAVMVGIKNLILFR